jgi:hypothetical protein
MGVTGRVIDVELQKILPTLNRVSDQWHYVKKNMFLINDIDEILGRCRNAFPWEGEAPALPNGVSGKLSAAGGAGASPSQEPPFLTCVLYPIDL